MNNKSKELDSMLSAIRFCLIAGGSICIGLKLGYGVSFGVACISLALVLKDEFKS